MKRLVVIAIMAAFLLGTVAVASAAKLTVSGGDFRVHANYVDNPNFDDDLKEDKFNIYQRFRTTFNFVANENLKAVAQLQFAGSGSDARWGGPGDAHVRGGGARSVDVRQAYLEFLIPNTQATVRAGWQWWALPNTLGSHIFDFRAPAFIVSSPINDMIGVTLGYARTSDNLNSVFDLRRNDFTETRDEVDHIVAIVPVTLDGFNINPFVHYARTGKYTGTGLVNDDNFPLPNFRTVGGERTVHTVFAGINMSMDMFDPIVVHADFNYGDQTRAARGAEGQSGWMANLAVEYKMDMLTPMIFGMYESGESRTSARPDRKGKVMPSLGAGDLNFTSFSTGGSQFGGTSWYAGDNLVPGFSTGAVGRWAAGMKLMDISFLDKLTHDFLVAYYQGTNDRTLGMFGTRDSAVEVNFDTTYMVYENLAAILELGYINPSIRNADDRGLADDASWKAAAGFRYRF